MPGAGGQEQICVTKTTLEKADILNTFFRFIHKRIQKMMKTTSNTKMSTLE